MVQKAEGVPNSLLVIRDSRGAVFGALVTEQMRLSEKDKYYGNGTIGVWSFASGTLQYYGWTYKNSYFLITSREALAVGGGGSFAIRLVRCLFICLVVCLSMVVYLTTCSDIAVRHTVFLYFRTTI